MRLTVSMPTWETPQLSRAVESVLTQTFTDLILMVVNDGGNPVDLDDHPRLVVFDLEENRGRYWADAVTLAACRTELWSPHDSDDVSVPDRFAKLVDALGDGPAVFSHALYHGTDGALKESPVRLHKVKPATLATIARYPAGVYRTDVARSIGIHPRSRGSFDTAFVSLLFHGHQPVVVDEYLYHVYKRPGSLTTSPATTFNTKWRRKQQALRRQLFSRAVRSPRESWPAVMGLGPELKPAFQADVDRLRRTLDSRS